MSATVMGAFGVLLRWLQCEAIFPDDSGLPVEGAPISGLVILALAGFTLVLWWLSGRLPVACAPKEPEDALAPPAGRSGAFSWRHRWSPA